MYIGSNVQHNLLIGPHHQLVTSDAQGNHQKQKYKSCWFKKIQAWCTFVPYIRALIHKIWYFWHKNWFRRTAHDLNNDDEQIFSKS